MENNTHPAEPPTQSLPQGTTETPETDAVIDGNTDTVNKLYETSQSLERRLAALQRENEGLREERDALLRENKTVRGHRVELTQIVKEQDASLATKDAQIAELREKQERDFEMLRKLCDSIPDDAEGLDKIEKIIANGVEMVADERDALRAELSALRETHEQQIQYTGVVADRLAEVSAECDGLNRELSSSVALGDALMDEKRGVMEQLAVATARAEAAEKERDDAEARYYGSAFIKGVMVERDAALALVESLKATLQDLGGYALSVRMDRLDETREFAMQTVDWCEGLLEKCEKADLALADLPVAGSEGGEK